MDYFYKHLRQEGQEQDADFVTAGGKLVYFQKPELFEVDDEDIYEHMRRTYRYNGGYPCDLVMHSIHTHDIASLLWPDDKEIHFRCLIHDDHEAIVGDISTGLKYYLPDFQNIEAAWEKRFLKEYGFEDEQPEEVKIADRFALLSEMLYFRHKSVICLIEKFSAVGETDYRIVLEPMFSSLFGNILRMTELERRTFVLQSKQHVREKLKEDA